MLPRPAPWISCVLGGRVTRATALTWVLVLSAAAAMTLDADARAAAPDGVVKTDAKPLGPEVEALIKRKEREAALARREGIKLLEAFLSDSKDPGETAEALFKLAELTWEEAQADYLDRMGRHQASIDACHKDRSTCPQGPRRQPKLDLSRAQGTYRRLIDEFPRFRKLDTVLYLLAFSLRDQGRLEEAAGYFQRLLDGYPRSRFRADAWMAVGEYRFYERQDYAAALKAYDKVTRFPTSPLYGLALFKTAWCYWKLGNTDRAALRFKDVLDLAKKAEGKSLKEQRRAAELQDQALEYLVELFTEDDSKSADDAFKFLGQIGGKAYSQRVLRRLADTVYDQTRYERAAEAYLLLLQLDPKHPEAPQFQERVVDSFQAMGNSTRATAEMRRLATNYGPKSAWAKANADRPKSVAAARASAEAFIRNSAKTLHAQAQKNEKDSKVVDKERYAQAAEAYGFYLEQFPDAKDAAELRYLRADVLFFKLGDLRGSGHEYLAVAKSKPVAAYHKDALLQAMSAFEKLRPPAPVGGDRKKRDITDDDRRFAEAADLYGTLFPDDRDIVTVIYKNGQFFYDYGDYDEATKRFGLILERYPSSSVAGAAGDRLLECLNAAKDYDNVETWARRLKKTQAFAARDDQQRLDRLISGAMMKSAENLAETKQTARAAQKFRAIAREYPGSKEAPRALANAGAAFEQAGQPDAAVESYEELVDKYPKAPEAAHGLFVAARIQESVAGYARAAVLYEQLATAYPQDAQAPVALRNAGILRQTLGQLDKAAALYADYEQRHKGRPEAKDVAFQRGLLLADKKDGKGSAVAFADFAKQHPGDGRVVEALVRQGEGHLRAGDDVHAKEALARALSIWKTGRRDDESTTWAARARYLQGELLFREYDRIKLAGRPRQLQRSLEDKAKLLDDAKKVYLDVVSFKVPEWATAALYRIGHGYTLFAKAMRDTKVPRELSSEEQQIYRDELEKSVVVIEDKALDAYRSGYAKALEIGVYNQHTRLLRQALAELDQQAYPPEAEVRLGLRLGEHKPELTPIEEIRRD